MTTETIQVQVRDLRGTHSAFLGWLGLDPRKERSLILRQQARDDHARELYRARQLEGLPEWMCLKCYRGEIPVLCLLGADQCQTAKFCLKQRIMEHAKRLRPIPREELKAVLHERGK